MNWWGTNDGGNPEMGWDTLGRFAMLSLVIKVFCQRKIKFECSCFEQVLVCLLVCLLTLESEYFNRKIFSRSYNTIL